MKASSFHMFMEKFLGKKSFRKLNLNFSSLSCNLDLLKSIVKFLALLSKFGAKFIWEMNSEKSTYRALIKLEKYSHLIAAENSKLDDELLIDFRSKMSFAEKMTILNALAKRGQEKKWFFASVFENFQLKNGIFCKRNCSQRS